MPNPPAHIDLALQAAHRLGHVSLQVNAGYFLLGATSPDVRVITRRSREEYHFAPLDFQDVGAGVKGLFGSYPDLRLFSATDGPTGAFIAGYITHLVADEVWIAHMFRPFFANPQVFGDEVLGKVMDRAMQLELDRRAWPTATANLQLVESATSEVSIGFISPQALADWRQWVVSSVARGFSWERLRFMARRIAGGDEAHPAPRVAEEFIQEMPASLGRLHDLVPRRHLDDFRQQAVAAVVGPLGDYLQ